MLSNHDIWGIMDMVIIFTVTIIHLHIGVINTKDEIVVRGYHGLSLEAKIEVEIRQDYLLDTVTTANLAQLDAIHSVLLPPDIIRHTKSRKQFGNTN